MTFEVIIPLMGGLGNQLFQICAGEFLEQNYDCRVKYNSYFLSEKSENQKHFHISRSLSVGELLDAESLIHSKISPISIKILNLFSPKKYVFEKSPDEKVLERVNQKSKIVFGYFQDVQMVDQAWKSIRQKMQNSDTFSKILGPEYIERIAIHARFGDYLNNPKARSFHGLTEKNYYLDGIDYFRKTSTAREINVYTDDYEMAKSIFDGFQLRLKAEIHSSESVFEDFINISRSSTS